MKNGTRLGKLKDKIMTKEPTTFSKVMAMAMKLIKLDEDTWMHRDDDRVPFKRDERSEYMRSSVQFPYLRGSVGSFKKEVKSYTPLNAPKSHILMWIRANGVGIPIPKNRVPPKEQ